MEDLARLLNVLAKVEDEALDGDLAYGELLLWWPVLDRAAGQLSTAGLSLARPLQLGL